MKKLYLAAFIGAFCVSAALLVPHATAQTTTAGNMASLKPEMTQQAQRDCLFADGGWVIVDCSAAAAASSSALTAWSRYIVQCRSDSYVAWADVSTDNADANDGYLPTGTWLPFMTDGTIRFFSCLNVTSDTDCRLIECK